MKATVFAVRGTVARYSEAAAMLKNPGDCVIVERGGIRHQLVIACPDGCGETLSINLDPRSGPAWRLYRRRGQWSLFPSIDRTTGCQSHFIMWGGHITWCEFDGEVAERVWPNTLADRVLEFLRSAQSASYLTISENLDEIPWDVLAVCRHLVRQELVFEGKGKHRGIFNLKR
jgi:hypothetical protein